MTTGLDHAAYNRVPKLAVFIVAAALAVLPWSKGWSLGLGEVSVSSAINEPLTAEIGLLNLQGLSEAELIVELGTAADYDLAGVRFNFSHTELDFVPDFSVPGRPVVRVSTDRPITEPYLNFVVQARWPAGRLLREYTILLDLPVFSGEQVSSTSGSSAPTTSVAPAPRVTTQPTQPVRVTPSATASAPAAPAGSYRVQFGDTLWEIAQRVADDTGGTHAQAMLALRDLNAQAFMDGNLNRLMSGSLLRIPSSSDLQARDAEAARAQVASELGLGGAPVQSTGVASDNTAANSSGQFRLAAADSQSAAGSASGVAGGQSAQLQSENAVLEEQLDAVRLENSDLRDRLAQLEEQIAVLERLVEVENSELAQAQQLGGQSAPAVVVQPPVAPQPSLMDRLMGWIQWIAIAVVGMLIAAYLVIKRRNENAAVLAMDEEADAFDDDQDEPAPLAQQFDRSDEEEDEFDADATLILGANAGLEQAAEDDGDFDLPTAQPDAEESEFDLNEADADTDFDDLDAFFSDLEGKEERTGDDFDADALIQDEPMESADFDLDEEESEASTAEADNDFAEDVDAEDGDEASSNTGLDFDLGDFGSAEAGDLDTAPASEQDEDRGMDFSVDLDSEPEALDTDATATGKPDSGAGEGLDFDLGGMSFGQSETDETETPAVAAESEDELDDAVDFDTALDDDVALATDAEADQQVPEDAETDEMAAFPLEQESVDGELDSFDDLEQSADEDDLDEAFFADMGEDDLDDLLGPEDGPSSMSEAVEPEAEQLDGPVEEAKPLSTAVDEDEALSSLTAMLDEGFDLDEDQDDQPQDANEAALADQDDFDTSTSSEASDESSDDLDDLGLDIGDDELDDDLGMTFDPDSDAESDDADTESDQEAECATKLELAEAYLDMGDQDGAGILLREVVSDGNLEQRSRAQELLDKFA